MEDFVIKWDFIGKHIIPKNLRKIYEYIVDYTVSLI